MSKTLEKYKIDYETITNSKNYKELSKPNNKEIFEEIHKSIIKALEEQEKEFIDMIKKEFEICNKYDFAINKLCIDHCKSLLDQLNVQHTIQKEDKSVQCDSHQESKVGLATVGSAKLNDNPQQVSNLSVIPVGDNICENCGKTRRWHYNNGEFEPKFCYIYDTTNHFKEKEK